MAGTPLEGGGGGSNTVRALSTFIAADKARLLLVKSAERVISGARQD
jgi:hypothetical protein